MDLNEREKAFEAKFQHDEELKFRIGARRAKLFGLSVAAELGLSGDTAEAYAKAMVSTDFDQPGIDDMLGKALADLASAGKDTSRHRLEVRLGELLDKATQDIMQK